MREAGSPFASSPRSSGDHGGANNFCAGGGQRPVRFEQRRPCRDDVVDEQKGPAVEPRARAEGTVQVGPTLRDAQADLVNGLSLPHERMLPAEAGFRQDHVDRTIAPPAIRRPGGRQGGQGDSLRGRT